MKPVLPSVLFAALLPVALAESPDLFRPQTLPSIPFSLLGSAHDALSQVRRVPDAVNPFTFRRAAQPKYYSAMPVIEPPRDIDPKFVHAPDSSVDYKLRIIRPNVMPPPALAPKR